MAHELLCGQPPFCGSNRAMLEKNIKNFHGLKRFRREGMAPGSTTKHIMDEWRQYNVREEAQDFIAHCLHPNAEYRLKAQEAVDSSPWLADSGAGNSTAHLTHVGDRLLASQVNRLSDTKHPMGRTRTRHQNQKPLWLLASRAKCLT